MPSWFEQLPLAPVVDYPRNATGQSIVPMHVPVRDFDLATAGEGTGQHYLYFPAEVPPGLADLGVPSYLLDRGALAVSNLYWQLKSVDFSANISFGGETWNFSETLERKADFYNLAITKEQVWRSQVSSIRWQGSELEDNTSMTDGLFDTLPPTFKRIDASLVLGFYPVLIRDGADIHWALPFRFSGYLTVYELAYETEELEVPPYSRHVVTGYESEYRGSFFLGGDETESSGDPDEVSEDYEGAAVFGSDPGASVPAAMRYGGQDADAPPEVTLEITASEKFDWSP